MIRLRLRLLFSKANLFFYSYFFCDAALPILPIGKAQWPTFPHRHAAAGEPAAATSRIEFRQDDEEAEAAKPAGACLPACYDLVMFQ